MSNPLGVQSSTDERRAALKRTFLSNGFNPGDGADPTALLAFSSVPPGQPDPLWDFDQIIALQAGDQRVYAPLRPLERTQLRLLYAATPQGRRRSVTLFVLSLALNMNRVRRSFSVRFCGPESVGIEARPLGGSPRLDMTIAGPGSGVWAAGPFDPWRDLLWNLVQKDQIEAIEIRTSLRGGTPLPRTRTIRVCVEAEHFDEWVSELLGAPVYGWDHDNVAPGRLLFLKPLPWTVLDKPDRSDNEALDQGKPAGVHRQRLGETSRVSALARKRDGTSR